MLKTITWISLVLSVLGAVVDMAQTGAGGDDGGAALAGVLSVLAATSDASPAPQEEPKPRR